MKRRSGVLSIHHEDQTVVMNLCADCVAQLSRGLQQGDSSPRICICPQCHRVLAYLRGIS